MRRLLGVVNALAALTLAVVVLSVAVNGFLFYQYRERLAENTTTPASLLPVVAPFVTAGEITTPTSPPESSSAETEAEAPPPTPAEQPTATAAKTDARSPSPERTRAQVEEPTARPEEADDLQVVIRVIDAPSWLSVRVDGQRVFAGVSEPGFSRGFEADRELSLETGNAGAVHVEVDGRDTGSLGASGEVTTRTYAASTDG